MVLTEDNSHVHDVSHKQVVVSLVGMHVNEDGSAEHLQWGECLDMVQAGLSDRFWALSEARVVVDLIPLLGTIPDQACVQKLLELLEDILIDSLHLLSQQRVVLDEIRQLSWSHSEARRDAVSSWVVDFNDLSKDRDDHAEPCGAGSVVEVDDHWVISLELLAQHGPLGGQSAHLLSW